jgi:hypothetical protein
MFSYLLENSFGKSDCDLLSAFGPMVVDLTAPYYVRIADEPELPASFSNVTPICLPSFLKRARFPAECYLSCRTAAADAWLLEVAPTTTYITTKLLSITMERNVIDVSVYLFILLMCISPSHYFYRTLGKGLVESCRRSHDFLGGQESQQFGTAVVRYWTVMDG